MRKPVYDAIIKDGIKRLEGREDCKHEEIGE